MSNTAKVLFFILVCAIVFSVMSAFVEIFELFSTISWVLFGLGLLYALFKRMFK